MKVIEGDLITMAIRGDFDLIVHGMNCFNNFENGIKKDIASVFPRCIEADKKTGYADASKLGTYSISNPHHNGTRVVNAYTQFGFGNDGSEYVNVVHLSNVFSRISDDFKNSVIGFPRIGSGSGGGCFDYLGFFISSHMEQRKSALIVPPRPIRRTRKHNKRVS